MGAKSSGAASGAAQGASVGAAFGGVGAIVGGVIGAVGGYFAGKSAESAAAKLTPEQKEMFNYILANVKTASEFGKFVTNMMRDPIISQTNWLNNLASGDRDAIMQAAGSQVSKIAAGGRQMIQTAAQLAPRSGVAAQFLSQLPFDTLNKQQAAISDTVMKGREMQGDWANRMTGVGASLMGMGTSGAEGANNFLQRKQEYAGQVGSAVAGSMYDIGKYIGGAYDNYTAGGGSGVMDMFKKWMASGGKTNPGDRNSGSGGTPLGSGGYMPSGPKYGYGY